MNFLGNEDCSSTELDPWRVILACLFEINSYCSASALVGQIGMLK